MYSSPVFPTPTSLWVSERSFSSARPETKRCAVFSFCTQLAAWQVPSRQKWIFPPLTLMPCHSGRDNQLRVKSPPMIVIINLKQKKHKQNQQKTTNSGVTTRHTMGQSNARMQNDRCRIECKWMHPPRVDTQVPICVSTKDGMAYTFSSFSPLGWQK